LCAATKHHRKRVWERSGSTIGGCSGIGKGEAQDAPGEAVSAAKPNGKLWQFERQRTAAQKVSLQKAQEAWQNKARAARLADYAPRKLRYRINFKMPVMPPDSKPSWAAEMHGDRRLWCRRYDACLSYAACLKWPGFDCGGCSVREEEPPTSRTLEGEALARQEEIQEVIYAIRRRG
jgi:hypothetical protein